MLELAFLTGRYALYIWPAYGLTLITFAVLVVAGWRRARHWRRKAETSGTTRQRT